MATYDNDKLVKISTKYSSSIRVKNKTFILFLRTPDIVEVYGPGIHPSNPLVLTLQGTDDPPILEKEFSYNEEDIWNLIKDHKKAMKKKGLK
jgi:hypothetical protein